MTDVEIEGEVIAEEETPSHLPAVRSHEAMVARAEISVDDVVAQRDKVKQVMERVMHEGAHYGRIPGIDKPTLFKPGAELLNTTFRLAPSYRSERVFHEDGHLTVVAKCVLTHAPSGIVLGEGEGLCSSRESKYASRNAKRACPACGAEAIIKGKAEYGGGWICWKKESGCGAKFSDGDPAIESQAVGKVTNPDLPDTWNTVLKMADKRALVAAVLNCTAASDIFTQDVEDTAAATATPAADPARAAKPPAAQPDAPPSGRGGNKLTAAQMKLIRVLMQELGKDADQLKAELGVDSMTDLSKADASKLIERLRAEQASTQDDIPF